MYELTISITFSKSKMIEHIAKDLENEVKLVGGMIVCGLFDGRASLSLAVPSKDKQFIKAKVLDIISEKIVTNYKYEFLNENIISGQISQSDRITLIRALSEFDKSTDIDLVKKNLIFSNNIVIDSLYHFKLGELKSRWKEIAELVNISMPNLIAGDCLIDMMKFLIAASPTKTEDIYLVENIDSIHITDNITKSEINFSLKKVSKNIEEKLISKLIYLSPKRIYVTSDMYNHFEFMKRIEELFDGKVFITR